MNFIERIKNKAKEGPKTLVLPEAMDERVLKAAEKIVGEGFAKGVILLGEEEKIRDEAQKCGVSLEGIKIINPIKSEKRSEFAGIYYQLRKHKNVTLADAEEAVKDPLYFGSLLVRTQDADTLVAGAVNTTSNVLRAALHVIDRTSKTGIVSSCFIMILPNPEYGKGGGILAFADAGVVPNPNSQQLADIAISTAYTFKRLTGCEPRVAMLSFSTKGSARHRMVDKVIEATKIAKENNPEILIDGELQSDAALVLSIAKRKVPDSPVAGKANVLIFPDLNSGNIAYKLVEHLAGARAYGPLIQGITKPISDLSRGCSADDIVDISAITLARA